MTAADRNAAALVSALAAALAYCLSGPVPALLALSAVPLWALTARVPVRRYRA